MPRKSSNIRTQFHEMVEVLTVGFGRWSNFEICYNLKYVILSNRIVNKGFLPKTAQF